MRPFDLAAIGVALATSMLIVQAYWVPPLISPAEVGGHTGERVRVEGMVMELRVYDDVSRFVLVADGAAVHARAEDISLVEDARVELTATVDREGGRPLLRVEQVTQAAGPADEIDLITLARDPTQHADRLVHVRGYLKAGTLEGGGAALRTTADGEGAMALDGILRYEARCVCFILHVDRAWMPS